MSNQVFPTKGNLINTKKSLSLAKLGYDLLERKRNILVRELMLLVDKAKILRTNIASTYDEAYKALQSANITLGVVDDVANLMPIEQGIVIQYRSVMGVDVPTVHLERTDPEMHYGFYKTNSKLDYAYICFHKVKEMTAVLAEIENSVFRLATAIRKTGRRSNALNNIVIPRLERDTKFISDSLDEKDREEFSRLKVIKKTKKA